MLSAEVDKSCINALFPGLHRSLLGIVSANGPKSIKQWGPDELMAVELIPIDKRGRV
jgi:hypothetical protein